MKAVIFLLCTIALGCSHRVIDFTMISTKNFDVSQKHIKAKDRVTGSDMIPIVFFIPCGSPDIKEAVDEAIEKIPGCVGLSDGVLYEKFWYIPFLFGQSWYEVEGTPVVLDDEKKEVILENKQETNAIALKPELQKNDNSKNNETITSNENTKEIEEGEKKIIIIKKDGHVKIIQNTRAFRLL